MNKLIPGVLYSLRAAREQRLRTENNLTTGEPDYLGTDDDLKRADEGFLRQDPSGTMLAKLFDVIDEDARRRM